MACVIAALLVPDHVIKKKQDDGKYSDLNSLCNDLKNKSQFAPAYLKLKCLKEADWYDNLWKARSKIIHRGKVPVVRHRLEIGKGTVQSSPLEEPASYCKGTLRHFEFALVENHSFFTDFSANQSSSYRESNDSLVDLGGLIKSLIFDLEAWEKDFLPVLELTCPSPHSQGVLHVFHIPAHFPNVTNSLGYLIPC